jgi:hypothetical protein
MGNGTLSSQTHPGRIIGGLSISWRRTCPVGAERNSRALIGPLSRHLSVTIGAMSGGLSWSTTINMAFVRHPSLGLSTRFLLSRATGTPSVALVSLRHLSTSRPTLQAQPVHHDPASHVKSPRLETGVYSARDEQDKYVNPYEGGPSALEKAAHLFFFTEIVRGSSTIVALCCFHRI